MLVLADRITNRLVYTLDFIFKERGIEYTLITDSEQFEASQELKLNYSSFESKSSSIQPSDVLFDSGIKKYTISFDTFRKSECLAFENRVDPVATVFYTLVRYEEYLDSDPDQHGRFQLKNSYLNHNDWVKKAMCDRWAVEILEFAGIEDWENTSTPQIIPTFDIDNTYAYKLKIGKRKWLSICRDLIQINLTRLGERWRVNHGREKDPYDTFSFIREISENYPVVIFWLVGDLGPKDRNIDVNDKEHAQLIREMDSCCSVNLHPSYASNSQKNKIEAEKMRLEKVLGHPVDKSRQHFLRVNLPDTFNTLESLGFEHDYSMGFAESYGFRCGTARAHLWYNLEQDRVTELMIHPFVYMDGTLNEYMGLIVHEAKDVVDELQDEISEFGGDFVSVWHNETIGEYGKWEMWSNVLRYTLRIEDED